MDNNYHKKEFKLHPHLLSKLEDEAQSKGILLNDLIVRYMNKGIDFISIFLMMPSSSEHTEMNKQFRETDFELEEDTIRLIEEEASKRKVPFAQFVDYLIQEDFERDSRKKIVEPGLSVPLDVALEYFLGDNSDDIKQYARHTSQKTRKILRDKGITKYTLQNVIDHYFDHIAQYYGWFEFECIKTNGSKNNYALIFDSSSATCDDRWALFVKEHIAAILESLGICKYDANVNNGIVSFQFAHLV